MKCRYNSNSTKPEMCFVHSANYETAPVFSLIEDVVLRKMRQYVGWTDGEGDGMFAPGWHFSHIITPSNTVTCLSDSARLTVL